MRRDLIVGMVISADRALTPGEQVGLITLLLKNLSPTLSPGKFEAARLEYEALANPIVVDTWLESLD